MFKRDPEIFVILAALVLVLVGVFSGLMLSEWHTARTAQSCIEQGKEWIDGSCVGR